MTALWAVELIIRKLVLNDLYLQILGQSVLRFRLLAMMGLDIAYFRLGCTFIRKGLRLIEKAKLVRIFLLLNVKVSALEKA